MLEGQRSDSRGAYILFGGEGDKDGGGEQSEDA